MKRIFRSYFIAALLFAASLLQTSTAQISHRDDKIYQASAALVKESVWGKALPQVKDYPIPEKFKGASKVVLLNYERIKAGDAADVKNPLAKITMIHREITKLNDAAAVKEYSEVSYLQLTKIKDYHNFKWVEYIGVRVIKADGKVEEVSAHEIVFTKDEAEERRAKLAIPDLEPGDIIDYYNVAELSLVYEQIRTVPFYFDFYHNAPTLHQEVHCAVGKKFATEYRCYNGAPDFIVTKQEDGSTLLDVSTDTVFTLPAGTPWVAPMRQLPFIELNIVRGDAVPYTPFTRRKPGEVFKNPDPEKMIRDAMINLNFLKSYVIGDGYWHMRKKSDAVEAYYQTLARRTLQEDSAAAELYYMFRFDYMFGNLFNPKAERIANLAKAEINTSMYAYLLSEYFKRHGLNAEVVLATTKQGVKMSELMDVSGLHSLCNVHGTHDIIFGMNDLYAPAFFIPGSLEGTADAVAIDTKNDLGSKMASNYTERRIQIPQSGAQDNVHNEMLSVMPDLAADGLRVARTTSLAGHYKEGIQRDLLLIEDFYDYERSFFNDPLSLTERLAAKSASKGEELTAAFSAARKGQKDAFFKEAKDWLEQDIAEQANINIASLGVRHSEPDFTYGSTFRINGLLKHAGNNYLLEVGKLAGIPNKPTEEQRTRNLDVYNNFARTVRIAVNIRIPEGYTAEGIEALAKTVKNGTGSFTAAASIEGNTVSITLETVFPSASCKKDDWPQMLALLDAMSDWKGSKILLRKKA